MSGGAADDVVDRAPAIGVARHNLESGLLFESARDEATHHCRNVDDHHFDWIRGRCRMAGSFYRGIHARSLTEQVNRHS
jgi:hypothetical protein